MKLLTLVTCLTLAVALSLNATDTAPPIPVEVVSTVGDPSEHFAFLVREKMRASSGFQLNAPSKWEIRVRVVAVNVPDGHIAVSAVYTAKIQGSYSEIYLYDSMTVIGQNHADRIADEVLAETQKANDSWVRLVFAETPTPTPAKP